MTLTVRLDPEEESKLKQIAELLRVENQSEAIRKMIHDTWATLQINSTFVERRGGHPEVLLLDAPSNLSERSVRKAQLKEYFAKRAARRKKGSLERKKPAPASQAIRKPESAKPRSRKRAD